MDPVEADRRRWPRITLTIPPDASDALAELAQGNYRSRRQEALRILVDGIHHERSAPSAPRLGVGPR